MKKIKLLIMDVDGTLTDGKIYMSNDGEIFKVFDIKDGCGIHDLLIPAGITPVIITGRQSKILENRCKEIGIQEVYQGVSNKVLQLKNVLNEKKIHCANVAYIGDDINDIDCMKYVKENGGIIGCPADSASSVIDMVDYVSLKNGGNGAVRAFIEWLIELQAKCEI